MSLKDEVRWVQRVELHRHYDSHRPSGPPITDLDLVPAIPIEALRAWLGSYCIDYPDLHQVSPSYYADVAQNELIEALLAELEGLS